MRTTWNGAISFGLVTIPVGLAPATKPAARQSDVSFRLLHRECKTPIKQKRWCPTHDREVGPDEIVRGWEVAKGEFVIVEDADLEAIDRDTTSRAIDITSFVSADDVDPIYYDRTYFLVPASAQAQRRPYVLLLEAMRETKTAALGSFVLAGKEKLALIRVQDDALVLETLFVAEDVYSDAEIEEAVGDVKTKKQEVALGAPGDRQPRGRVRPDRARQRVPARPADAARGEARGRAAVEARGRRGGGGPGDRPHGGVCARASRDAKKRKAPAEKPAATKRAPARKKVAASKKR